MLTFLATATATETSLNQAIDPVIKLINSMVGPALSLVAAVGVLYCIVLGVRYAKADDPQEHMKAKKGLVNAIVGFVLIFVLILMLRLMMPVMINWINTDGNTTTTSTSSSNTDDE